VRGLRGGADGRRVAEHLGKRDLRLDDLGSALLRLHSFDAAAAAVQVADDAAQEALGRPLLGPGFSAGSTRAVPPLVTGRAVTVAKP
jgi:hypothetical protein